MDFLDNVLRLCMLSRAVVAGGLALLTEMLSIVIVIICPMMQHAMLCSEVNDATTFLQSAASERCQSLQDL